MYKAIHQSIRSSEKHAELSDFAERVWTRGLVASDMVGRITANPKKFHAEAIPMLPYDEAKILAAFNELQESRLCHFYEVEGKHFMVFHDHDEHNTGAKNLKYQPKSKIPPPPPSLCFCVTYQPHEDGGSTAVPTAVPTAVATAIVLPPSHVLSDVPVQEGESDGETWPPVPATARGNLWRLFKQSKITGTPSQLRQYFEAWYAQAGAQRLEQILMDPKVKGVDVFAVQRWFFNDILGNSRRVGS